MAKLVLSALVGLTFLACGPAGPKVDVEAERNEVLATDRLWSKTPPDVDAFVGNMTANAVFLAGNAPAAEDPAAIRASVEQMFGAPGFALAWSPTRAEVSACGDLAYSVGRYQHTSEDAAGNTRTVPGKYVTVWKKQDDGTWKAVVDAPSEDAPPAAPEAPPFDLAGDATKLDPNHYTLEFENDYVRILRVKYGPGEKSIMHEHPPGVAVLLSEHNVRMYAPDDSSEVDLGKPGEARWADAVTHLPENLNDAPLEVVLVELKTAEP